MLTEVTIRNCPPGFRFVCAKQWEELTQTASRSVRFCEQCRREVHFCRTDGETIAHAREGHCIAREGPAGSELSHVTIGQPDAAVAPMTRDREMGVREADKWAMRERGIDDSIRNATTSTRSCPDCGYPAPNWRKTCRVCGREIGRVGSA